MSADTGRSVRAFFDERIGMDQRFVYGTYRRHMKAIGYLDQVDKPFGARATTRNWNTIMAILRILKAER